MSVGQTPSSSGLAPAVDVAAGAGLALLVALSRASRERPERVPDELGTALAACGDTAGETWLNLLGVPLDAGSPYTAARLLEALDDLDGLELRRHLLGRFAWSWCTLAGTDVIEAAAAGDAGAVESLLSHPRYYGGHASESLSVLLQLDPDETKRRIRDAVVLAAPSLLTERSEQALRNAEEEASEALGELPPLEAIERLTAGYRYVPEPEAERVTLVPHLEASPGLVLAQHRSARVIAYRARPEPDTEERLVALGRALDDPRRVQILGLVARGTGRVPELAKRTGLSRSTVHHHLSLLRDAGLLVVEGNARAYTFALREGAAGSAASLLADAVGTPLEQGRKEK